jgi:hypothetical protein
MKAVEQVRVRVMFGQHPIGTPYVGNPAAALRYEAAMKRRFPSCRVISEPLPGLPVVSGR